MKKNVPVIIVILGFLAFLFFFRLGDTSLLSYDEAWYADITRNLVRSKNPFRVTFNGGLFTDHPPFGFIMMAVPTLLFGSNEFSARLVSAILGVLSVALIYLTGKRLRDDLTGILASIMLISSLWFMLRARSGNLDIPFLFLEVLTVFFLTQNDKKYLTFSTISFSLMCLTKTLVGFGMVPLILYFYWIKRRQLTIKTVLNQIVLWLLIFSPWYLYNLWLDKNFLYHNFLEIGARSESNAFGFQFLIKNINYLEYGIGKWRKPLWLALLTSIFFYVTNKQNRHVLNIFFLWLLGFIFFFFSNKTEIWHLIPIYPIAALLISYIFVNLTEGIFSRRSLPKFILLAGFVTIGIIQFHGFSNLLYPTQKVVSPEKDISAKAKKYSHLYLMDTFYPAAVYYSEQGVNPLYWDPEAYEKMKDILIGDKDGVFIINNDFMNRLQKDNVKIKILEKNNSYYLVTGANKIF